MTAATVQQPFNLGRPDTFKSLEVPLAADAIVIIGTWAGFVGGQLVPPETAGAENFVMVIGSDDADTDGVIDNTGGADGAITVQVEWQQLKHVWRVKNDDTNPVTAAELYNSGTIFWLDNQTVTADDADGTLPDAGIGYAALTPIDGFSSLDAIWLEV